jgi:hypothetical protein
MQYSPLTSLEGKVAVGTGGGGGLVAKEWDGRIARQPVEPQISARRPSHTTPRANKPPATNSWSEE